MIVLIVHIYIPNSRAHCNYMLQLVTAIPGDGFSYYIILHTAVRTSTHLLGVLWK